MKSLGTLIFAYYLTQFSHQHCTTPIGYGNYQNIYILYIGLNYHTDFRVILEIIIKIYKESNNRRNEHITKY